MSIHKRSNPEVTSFQDLETGCIVQRLTRSDMEDKHTYFGHHHSWTATGAQVLYSGYVQHTDDGVRKVPRLCMVNFDGSDQRTVVNEPLGGHPIASPDGAKITTWDDRGVILVDVAKQSVEYLAMLRPSFDMSHRGTHPHCIWSQDGRHIVYNSAQTGNSQLYQITL